MGSVGFGRTANEQGRERAMKALQDFLRPEFINRIDEIVYFNQLTEENFRLSLIHIFWPTTSTSAWTT